MEDRLPLAFTAQQRRKSTALPPLRDKEMQNCVNTSKPVNNNHRTIERRRSLQAPPTWQSSARVEKSSRLPVPTAADKPRRKYSEDLHTQRRNYVVSGMDPNSRFQTGLLGFANRRSRSLTNSDVNGVLLEEDVLLRHEGLEDGDVPKTVATFSFKHSFDDIPWSRYWHDARDRSYLRDRVLNKEAKARWEKLRNYTFNRNEDGPSTDDSEAKDEKTEDVEEEITVEENQLSLEERLEKIERDCGLVEFKDDESTRKPLLRTQSLIY